MMADEETIQEIPTCVGMVPARADIVYNILFYLITNEILPPYTFTLIALTCAGRVHVVALV
jgi:hypothetical protein